MTLEHAQTLLNQIPIAGTTAMGLTLVALTDDTAAIRLPFAPNSNDKGTAFAGSIYSALVLSGWILAMNAAERAAFPHPWAAVIDSRCTYTKAICSDTETCAIFEQPPILQLGARNTLHITVTLPGVTFSGTYAVGSH